MKETSPSIRPEQHDGRLKIAVLVRRFVTTGGAERYAYEVTRRLALKHDVHVFAQEWSFEGSEKLTFHKIPMPLAKPSFVNQLLFSFFTRRALKNASFDIVHTHERVTSFDVLTIHCPCYRGFITEQKNLLKKIGIWLSVVASPRDLAYLWLEKKQFMYKKDRLLIAVSENVKRDVQRNYNLPDAHFHLAYPGVNAGEFITAQTNHSREQLRLQLGIGTDEVVILFVGTEFKRKGLGPLLEAYALLLEAKTRLIIAGGGDTSKYTRLAQNFGIADTVTFLGLVGDMGPIYAVADICILPTLSDPYAMAPIEAMASGVATITSSSLYAGSSERIQNGEALLVNAPSNPEEIAYALGKLLDKDHRTKLAQKGYQLAKKLTWEITTAETLSTYYELLQLKISLAMH